MVRQRRDGRGRDTKSERKQSNYAFFIYILLSFFRVGCPDNNRPVNPLRQPISTSSCRSTLLCTRRDHQLLLIFQSAHIRARNTFNQMQFVGMRQAAIAEPEFFVETLRVDDERVASHFPTARP